MSKSIKVCIVSKKELGESQKKHGFSGCQNFECQDLFSLSKRLSEAAIKFSLSRRNCRGETEYITMSNLKKVGEMVR